MAPPQNNDTDRVVGRGRQKSNDAGRRALTITASTTSTTTVSKDERDENGRNAETDLLMTKQFDHAVDKVISNVYVDCDGAIKTCGTKFVAADDDVNSVLSVCNVSKARATELLEASNGDLARAIDIFLHQQQQQQQ